MLNVIALVGNPNCGKTTLFNSLTGSRQQVGNWSGVTVEGASGSFCSQSQSYTVVDLPGTYTLTSVQKQGPQDETFTGDYVKQGHFSFVLNIVDALHLERNLYLTVQCLEQSFPVVIALNRMDLAQKQRLSICLSTLEQQLGCRVIPVVAREGMGLETLKRAFLEIKTRTPLELDYPQCIQKALDNINQAYQERTGKLLPRYTMLSWLEGEIVPVEYALEELVSQLKREIAISSGKTADVWIAMTRYQFIEQLLSQVRQSQTQETNEEKGWTPKFDKIVCHKWFGLPIFFAVMYSLFFFAINIGGAFQDFFEQSSQAIFVEQMNHLLQQAKAPEWLMILLVSGLGEGIATVLTFIPVIGAMFLALAFLEDCGYMARAAFVVDRLMRAIGLPGKSFVPMIVGFGCNVPAIMGMRALENRRDRILAVMMSPFMSCGARLAIFTVFVSAFFPQGGQNIVFSLYAIGILMAVLTGLMLKKTVLRGEIAPLLLEMPVYQWPHGRTLCFHAWHRLKHFIFNAGKLIVPICMVIGVLNNITFSGKWVPPHQEQTSVLAHMGRAIVPVFKPMGIEDDNWPAAVGLLTGVLAKEVVIGSLNALYSPPLDTTLEESDEKTFSLTDRLVTAMTTIPANLLALGQAWQNPVLAKAPMETLPHHSYGEMVKRFNSQAAAFAYLLFVLLYFPCVSATAAMLKEVQRGWTLFSLFWTTGLAYGMAVAYFQLATIELHPMSSLAWLACMASLAMMTFLGIRHYGRLHIPRALPTPIVLK